MRPLLVRAAPVLQLTRVTTAFASVANVWFVILWTRLHEQETANAVVAARPLGLLLAGGGLSAIALYAFAVCLNDFLDVKRDRAMWPDRPLPSERVSREHAVTLVAITLIVGLLGATVFDTGGVILALVIAVAILFYNGAGRFVPAIGLVVLGAIYASHMLVPNIGLRFLWPVWLVMTHAVAVAGAAHVIGRKVPRISQRAAVGAVLGWALCSAALVSLTWERCGSLWPDWVSPTAAAAPLALVVVYILVSFRKLHQTGPGPRSAEKITRYGALWQALYAVAWCVGIRAWSAALILGAVALAGYLGMTILREIYGLVEHPVGFRR